MLNKKLIKQYICSLMDLSMNLLKNNGEQAICTTDFFLFIKTLYFFFNEKGCIIFNKNSEIRVYFK